jgi:hypothetical protein
VLFNVGHSLVDSKELTKGGRSQSRNPLIARALRLIGFADLGELKEILRQTCFLYEGVGPVPSQVHSYLSSNFKELRNLTKDDPALVVKAIDRWYVPDPSKQSDLDKIRERALLIEFEVYRNTKERKLKVFRSEAIRAGFKAAYDKQNYKAIVDVATKIPENVLQEDEKLLMYYDVASMRLGDE